MSAFHDNMLLGASGQQGYQISRSVRLRSSASAYFSRTPSIAGNRRTWTWSGWVKLGAIGQWEGIFNAGSSGNQFAMYLYTDYTMYIQDYTGSNNIYLQTSQVFRDPSAWYHIVFAVDTTQATSTNRFKLYVNGAQVTSFVSTTYPSQNYDTQVNSTSYQNNIGLNYQFGTSNAKYFDGYLTEINFIDGQALTPSSFGETDTITGVWKPKKYAGTYGTNGFYLNFSDNSNNTAATIGKDYSGNGNNWTPNNISVTSGVTYDSMLDTPTPYADGGNGRGNYATLNPLQPASTTVVVPTDGNLRMTGTTTGNNVTGTMAIAMATYFEGTAITGGGTLEFGIKNLDTGNTYAYDSNGNKYLAGTGTAYGATFTTNDIIGVAVDPVNLTLQFYKNGTSQGVISSAFPAGNYVPFFYASNTNASAANFGQRPFSYTPPSGFKALNTQNLPTPTISNGATVMAASTYTGNGSTQSIVNSGNNAGAVSFQPDLVWVKGRSGATDHAWYDSVRGVQKQLESNTTTAETTETTGLTAFGSTGFTVGALAQMNTSTATYVAWQWQAGQGSTSSNTSGSITSTVSVNATAGFSVVTFTTPSTNTTSTIGHGLGVAPSLIIVKSRSTTSSWYVYHSSLGATKAVLLNTTAASDTSQKYWNNTSPTSSVFTIMQTGVAWWDLSATHVAYCFSEVAGYSKFGSYTGNGSADGPFVYCGFRPRFVMIKRTDAAGNSWIVYDTARVTYNADDLVLYTNLSNAEDSGVPIDVLSNGFKQRSTWTNGNASGGTYIFMAFAENPINISLAR